MKKCQVFGNFLTFKWQFSEGSAGQSYPQRQLLLMTNTVFIDQNLQLNLLFLLRNAVQRLDVPEQHGGDARHASPCLPGTQRPAVHADTRGATHRRQAQRIRCVSHTDSSLLDTCSVSRDAAILTIFRKMAIFWAISSILII